MPETKIIFEKQISSDGPWSRRHAPDLSVDIPWTTSPADGDSDTRSISRVTAGSSTGPLHESRTRECRSTTYLDTYACIYVRNDIVSRKPVCSREGSIRTFPGSPKVDHTSRSARDLHRNVRLAHVQLHRVLVIRQRWRLKLRKSKIRNRTKWKITSGIAKAPEQQV